MKNQHTRMSIGTQIKTSTQPAIATSVVPLGLFAALIGALAFLG